MKKYAIVGTGSRSRMFQRAICETFKKESTLVALCDVNQGRMDLANAWAQESFGQKPVPTFLADAFESMVKTAKPDVVVVTCIDRMHHSYIVRAMELGCDVISEKPMTVDAEKAREILSAIERTGRKLRVTFNYRYSPRNAKVKELIQGGEIGEVTGVHFEWMLDTQHGADYFRRWHRDKKNGGGLLVHKSTHHFDLVNWWLDSTPIDVFAWGRLAFYGRENAERRGVKDFYQRASGSELAAKDPFAFRAGETEKRMYLDCEKHDGYQRDQSVFGDGIDIEDNLGVMVRYANKAVLTYSLCAACPREGYRVTFNGTEGRLEIDVRERDFNVPHGSDPADPSYAHAGREEDRQRITLQKHWQVARNVTWVEAAGGHGGGDDKMLREVFQGNDPNDPFRTAADHRDGVKSIMVGIAGNESMKKNAPVRIADLLRGDGW